MKKILCFLSLGMLLVACNSSKGVDNGSVKGITVKKAGIEGARTLAIAAPAQGVKSVFFTKADDGSGENALYKVSADNKFIEVSYTFNVEVEGDAPDKTVIETIKRNINIVPNFIYSIGGGDWLWLANCFMDVPNYREMPEDGAKKILTRIRDEFNEKYHDTHGAHYLINKVNGAMYQWEQADGAPASLSDGYNPPSMLDDWFVTLGSDMYVREGGYNFLSAEEGTLSGRVLRVRFSSAGPVFTEVIPASQGVSRLLPGENCLGLTCGQGSNIGYYVYTPSDGRIQAIPLDQTHQNIRWTVISVDNKLYALKNNQEGNLEGGPHSVGFYEITVAEDGVKIGSAPIAETYSHMGLYDEIMNGWVCTTPTYAFFEDGSPVKVHIFDSVNKTLSSGDMPDHYPYSAGGVRSRYFEGIAYEADGDAGFWICDLSKSEAEYVPLDKSGIASYNISSMVMEHFEAGNMTMKYRCATPNGDVYAFATVKGANRGKLAVITGDDGSAGYIINVLLNL